MNDQIFYTMQPGQRPQTPDACGYQPILWRPTSGNIRAGGLSLYPWAVWWAFHYTRVFRNREYRVLVMYDGDRLIHRSGVFPGFFRFPFMESEDLQIGDVWTHPDYRSQGLAGFAVRWIIHELYQPGRRFWYVVASDNIPSIRVVERAGFLKTGYGKRTRRFGLSLFGKFEIVEHVNG